MSLLHSRKTFQKILFPNFGLDGKKINEVLFCQSFLETHPMKCIQGSFFTVDGLVDDEESLKMEIYDRIKDYTCCGIAKKASQLLDALKLACYSPPLPVQLDRIHVANGIIWTADLQRRRNTV